jgi:hypothetical protein
LTPLVATNELNAPCATRLTADDDIEEMKESKCSRAARTEGARIGKGDHVLASTDSAKKGVVVDVDEEGRRITGFLALFKVRWNDELEESGWLRPGDIVFDEDSNKNPPLTVGEECFAQFPIIIKRFKRRHRGMGHLPDDGKLEYFKVYYILRHANYLNCVEKADDGKLHFYKVYIVPHIQNILSHTEYLNYVEEADDGEVHYYHNFSKVFRIFLCF